MTWRRRALALLLTPIAAGVLQTLLLVGTAQSRGQRIESRYWGLLLAVMTIQAALMLLVAGVPAWYGLRIFRKSSVQAYALTGLIIGIIGVGIRIGLHLGEGADPRARLWEMGITAAAGAGAAVFFRTVSGTR